MALHANIGAGTFSALAFHNTEVNTMPADEAGLKALFAAPADFVEVPNIRDLPDNIGTPANIVKVPEYGRATTLSIGAQPDAPDLELTINYVASKWAPGTDLMDMIDKKTPTVFQLALLNAEPAGLATTTDGSGLDSVDNTLFYFLGRMESLLVSPSREDSNTATVSLSVLSDFEGPFTVDTV
jgi:hypothetical protein